MVSDRIDPKKWFTPKEFETLIGVFSYHIKEEELNNLLQSSMVNISKRHTQSHQRDVAFHAAPVLGR